MNGAHPRGSLALIDGVLYGTTEGGGLLDSGTVYSIAPSTGQYRRIHDFSYRDRPWGGVQVSSAGGSTVVGTTRWGGQFGGGSLFEVDPISGRTESLNEFASTDGNAAFPISDPIRIDDGSCIVVVSRGCANGHGGIVKVDVNSRVGLCDVLYGFQAAIDEAWISMCEDGNVYVTVAYDPGVGVHGQLIGIDPKKLYCEELQTFPMPDAPQPSGPAIIGPNRGLLGTAAGGIFAAGVLYSVSEGMTFTSRHHFDPSEGGGPGWLCRDGGYVYGNCYSGGAYGFGSIYRLSLWNGGFDVLHHFRGQEDGACPSTSMAMINGKLFGATRYSNVVEGDFGHSGVLYGIDVKTTELEVLHAF